MSLFSVYHTDLAVGQLVSARTQKDGLLGRLVERCPPGDVGPWVCQTQPAALQGDVHRVCDGGVEGLRVVAMCLIHPTLVENNEDI